VTVSHQDTLVDDAHVRDVDIAERMERAFLDYSMSVIVGRALPDVRDGLKPVQRRILHAMGEAGLRPDRPYRKCASAVGDVMKKYHPHGDAAIYDALVRMGQEFTSRLPLIDGHGNFGSVDGDGAAAMRYTEARLSPAAMTMLDGIDEDTVDFVANYDGYEREPVVLPARLPNLLVNGSSGIAVGMATTVPPHNLGEVIDACLLLLDAGEVEVGELMEVLPAPDFPTGGRIVVDQGIAEAYRTGRGTITVEAVAATETRSGGLPRIVITEIPYQVNKAALLERIAELVKNKKIESIRDLRDESSRDGMRVVVELKRGEDPGAELAKLQRLTELRSNVHVNMVALVGNGQAAPQPCTLSLPQILGHYLDFQRDVLTRRTTHRRDRAAERAHILEGLLLALTHLDDVVALIRASETPQDARSALMAHYELSQAQAQAILDMPLRRLAQLERQKLADELAELQALIAELEAILADPARLNALLAHELREVRDAHADQRRSRLADQAGPSEADAAPGAGGDTAPQLGAQEITVFVTAAGYVKPIPRRRISPAHNRERDPAVTVLRATSDDVLLLVDADGGGWRVHLADVAVTTMRQRGTSLAQLLGEGPEAPIAGAVVLDEAAPTVATVSRRGLVKRSARQQFQGRARSMVAAGVTDVDEIVAVLGCGDADHLVVAHDAGQVIRFSCAEVRLTGRAAKGVTGLAVPQGSRVVAASVLPGGDDRAEIMTLTDTGEAKRAPATGYPAQGRGGKGVQTGGWPLAWCGVATDLHVPTSARTVLLRAAQVATSSRTSPPSPTVDGVTGPVAPERTLG
jgi:DNA gyrase subunit A